MFKFEEWSNPIKGLYRHVISAGCCYEIIIIKHPIDSDILNATANLYVSGDWIHIGFIRELLFTGSFSDCIKMANKDYTETIQEALS